MVRSHPGSPHRCLQNDFTLGTCLTWTPTPRLETKNARHRDWNNDCHPNLGLEMETALGQTWIFQLGGLSCVGLYWWSRSRSRLFRRPSLKKPKSKQRMRNGLNF